MVVLGTYWIEPHFPKPGDVVINGLVVFISISTLDDPPHAGLWAAVRLVGAALSVSALALIWFGDPAAARRSRQPMSRIAFLVLTRLGGARVLYSVVFILALVSYFDLQGSETRLALAFWGAALIAKEFDLDGLLRAVHRLLHRGAEERVGTVGRLMDPDIVRFRLDAGVACARGTVVALSATGEVEDSTPVGLVVGHRLSVQAVEAEALLFDLSVSRSAMEQRHEVIKVDLERHPKIAKRLESNPLASSLERLIGFSYSGSEIARLYFELTSDPGLEEGHLVAVPGRRQQPAVLFQVINGRHRVEASIDGSDRAFTVAEAEQVGTWNPGRQGFDTHNWVVKENAPVLHVRADVGVERRLADRLLEVGNVPNSSYPATVDLHDLALFHSAILGVTGSGKSFLAYHLIERMSAEGIKVLCLDITGDYRRYLRDPVVLATRGGAVEAFLGQAEHGIGIVAFDNHTVHPIDAAHAVAKRALDWCRADRGPDEIRDPRPKVLLVLEEAHTLVPEWNSNPERNKQDTVNRTAQIALQARKYGLGFMIITQRTANVTKSILNQCNTIFAFQAYDETGFEFMKNYMGLHYVQALPNLKKRQGVIVGKASTSDRPLIVRFLDQDRRTTDGQVPVYPEQEEEVGDAAGE
jgi:hypothetical protein